MYKETKRPNNSDFEDVVIHLKEYLNLFEIEDINNDVIFKWNHSQNLDDTFPLTKSYQDPQTMCYSWKSQNISLSYVKLYFLKDSLRKTASKEHEYFILSISYFHLSF